MFGPLAAVDPLGPGNPPVVLAHGLGLGPWLWEPWFPLFIAEGLRPIALELPGHDGTATNVGLADVVAGVEAALAALDEPAVLVGHSFGGLVAQLVAAGPQKHRVKALALVCPLPPGQVRVVPSRYAVQHAIGLARDFVRGRPLGVSFEAYHQVGMHTLAEPAARALHTRVRPFPNRLCRDLLFARPAVDPAAITVPVLVAIGKADRMIAWQEARVLADLYEAVTWRYDDLAHTAPWEPGGERMGRDLARWCAAPARPEVIESEAFRPGEGVGHDVRMARRGEAAKKRSAYGQKRSAR